MLNPLTHRRILKKGLPGQAQIVEMGALNRNSTTFNLPITLQVHVEGITPYEVEDQWWVKAKNAVALHGTIPVKVNPDDHQEVAIDWDGVMANYEQEVADRREALASGGMPPGVTVNIAEPQVIDLGDNPAAYGQIQDALGQFGIDADQVFGAGAQSNADDPEDTLAQLERLAALHRSGALTDAEFEQQKRRILGEA